MVQHDLGEGGDTIWAGLGLAGQLELGVGLCVELRLVCGLVLKWGWCVCERSVWVSNSRKHLKVKWEWKWSYGFASIFSVKLNSIFSLTLFSSGAKHEPRCKIFSENHLHPKQTQSQWCGCRKKKKKRNFGNRIIEIHLPLAHKNCPNCYQIYVNTVSFIF